VAPPDQLVFFLQLRPMAAEAAEHSQLPASMAALEAAVGRPKVGAKPEELPHQDRDRMEAPVTAQSQQVQVVEVVALAQQDQTERLEWLAMAGTGLVPQLLEHRSREQAAAEVDMIHVSYQLHRHQEEVEEVEQVGPAMSLEQLQMAPQDRQILAAVVVEVTGLAHRPVRVAMEAAASSFCASLAAPRWVLDLPHPPQPMGHTPSFL